METLTGMEVSQEAKKLVNEARGILEAYRSYEIVDNKTYTESGEVLKQIKFKTKELEDQRKSMTKPMDEAKRKVMDFFRKPLDYLSQAENIIKRSMLSFQQEQERIRREREDKLRRQAEAEEERKRKALEERARKAEEKGNLEKAEELREKKEEVFVPAPIVPNQVEKVPGIATKIIWKFSIVDVQAIPRDYLTPDVQKIGAMARSSKGTLAIPGIRIYSEEVIASGR